VSTIVVAIHATIGVDPSALANVAENICPAVLPSALVLPLTVSPIDAWIDSILFMDSSSLTFDF
jgi:hypothetical protein